MTSRCVAVFILELEALFDDGDMQPWEYDKKLHEKRNEVGRLFRKLKGFRRIFTRFDKLDVSSSGLSFFP